MSNYKDVAFTPAQKDALERYGESAEAYILDKWFTPQQVRIIQLWSVKHEQPENAHIFFNRLQCKYLKALYKEVIISPLIPLRVGDKITTLYVNTRINLYNDITKYTELFRCATKERGDFGYRVNIIGAKQLNGYFYLPQFDTYVVLTYYEQRVNVNPNLIHTDNPTIYQDYFAVDIVKEVKSINDVKTTDGKDFNGWIYGKAINTNYKP